MLDDGSAVPVDGDAESHALNLEFYPVSNGDGGVVYLNPAKVVFIRAFDEAAEEDVEYEETA